MHSVAIDRLVPQRSPWSRWSAIPDRCWSKNFSFRFIRSLNELHSAIWPFGETTFSSGGMPEIGSGFPAENRAFCLIEKNSFLKPLTFWLIQILSWEIKRVYLRPRFIRSFFEQSALRTDLQVDHYKVNELPKSGGHRHGVYSVYNIHCIHIESDSNPWPFLSFQSISFRQTQCV